MFNVVIAKLLVSAKDILGYGVKLRPNSRAKQLHTNVTLTSKLHINKNAINKVKLTTSFLVATSENNRVIKTAVDFLKKALRNKLNAFLHVLAFDLLVAI